MQTREIVIELPDPHQMSRAHILVRVLILAFVGGVLGTFGWPDALLYAALPVIAAIRLSQHGAAAYLAHDAPRVARVIGWLLGLAAYLLVLTDRFPTTRLDEPVRMIAIPEGEPTVSSAVLRIITSIPMALFLVLLGLASSIVWLLTVIWVLASGRYPMAWFDLQCGVLRCHARFYAYHASITSRYPPFTLDLGPTRSLPIGGAQAAT